MTLFRMYHYNREQQKGATGMTQQTERPQQYPIGIIIAILKTLALITGWLLIIASGILEAPLFYLTFASGETVDHFLEDLSDSPFTNIAPIFLMAQFAGLALIAAARRFRSSAFIGGVITSVIMIALIVGVSLLGVSAGV